MAGLLHDVGKGVAMRSVAELTDYGKLPVLPGEGLRRILHRVHVEIGEEMHKVWQLPPTLADVAAHHHLAHPPGDPGFVHLVALASAVDLVRREPKTSPAAPAEAVHAAKTLGLGPARVKALGTDLEQAEAWVKTVFPS
jgi:HD-like signal output (HDOD) protein